MTISNQSFNTSTFSSEEFCEETIPLSLIIGQAGNGKTQIMRKIFDEDVRIQLFKPILQEQLRYYFVDTSSFDFDSDYDSREEQIENYKNLLREYPNRVRSILIVVNFERTDLMKKKVININKYFSKFKNLFTLVITKFNLSEDIQRDKEQLKQSFKFLQAQNIIFVGDDTKKQKLLKDLRAKSLPRLEDGYEFNSVDTLFEEEDEEELKKLQNDLLKKFN
ncbi:unnamed protein product [Paramecium pentaurelia]|nr:unnamed protein product [Paramecium pentaurelia]